MNLGQAKRYFKEAFTGHSDQVVLVHYAIDLIWHPPKLFQKPLRMGCSITSELFYGKWVPVR